MFCTSVEHLQVYCKSATNQIHICYKYYCYDCCAAAALLQLLLRYCNCCAAATAALLKMLRCCNCCAAATAALLKMPRCCKCRAAANAAALLRCWYCYYYCCYCYGATDAAAALLMLLRRCWYCCYALPLTLLLPLRSAGCPGRSIQLGDQNGS